MESDERGKTVRNRARRIQVEVRGVVTSSKRLEEATERAC